MKKNEEIVLTEGSKYRVKSLEAKDKPMVTHGTFKGYTAIGSNEGICMELDESYKEAAGRLRVIPTHMILSIDVIKVKKEKDKKEERPSTYFR